MLGTSRRVTARTIGIALCAAELLADLVPEMPP